MRHTIFMTIAMLSLIFTACGSDDDTNQESETPKNSFTYDGKIYKLGWAAYTPYDDNLILILSENEPASKTLSSTPHAVRIAISKENLGKTLSVGNNNLQMKINDIYVADDMSESDVIGTSSGILNVKKTSEGTNAYTITFKIELKNGKTIEGNYSGTFIDNADREYSDSLYGRG